VTRGGRCRACVALSQIRILYYRFWKLAAYDLVLRYAGTFRRKRSTLDVRERDTRTCVRNAETPRLLAVADGMGVHAAGAMWHLR